MSAAPRPDIVYKGAEDKLKQLAADCFEETRHRAPLGAGGARPLPQSRCQRRTSWPRPSPQPKTAAASSPPTSPGRGATRERARYVRAGAATTDHLRQRRTRRGRRPLRPAVRRPTRLNGTEDRCQRPRAYVTTPIEARYPERYPERLCRSGKPWIRPLWYAALWIGAFGSGPCDQSLGDLPSPSIGLHRRIFRERRFEGRRFKTTNIDTQP